MLVVVLILISIHDGRFQIMILVLIMVLSLSMFVVVVLLFALFPGHPFRQLLHLSSLDVLLILVFALVMLAVFVLFVSVIIFNVGFNWILEDPRKLMTSSGQGSRIVLSCGGWSAEVTSRCYLVLRFGRGNGGGGSEEGR